MYKIVLIIIALLVIYGVFAFQNPFNSAKVTAVRGIIGVVVGWALIILASILINKVDLSGITAAHEILALEEINGARMMGAMFFGWAYPLIFIELIWGSVYLFRYGKDKGVFKNILNTKAFSFK